MAKAENVLNEISGILDPVMVSLFQRMAGLTIASVSTPCFLSDDRYWLSVTTMGDYSVTLTLCAESPVMNVMTSHMKHGAPVSESDVTIYMTEFFNVLCGHIVSSFNRLENLKARFSLPQMQRQAFAREKSPLTQEFYYRTDYGGVMIVLYCHLEEDGESEV